MSVDDLGQLEAVFDLTLQMWGHPKWFIVNIMHRSVSAELTRMD